MKGRLLEVTYQDKETGEIKTISGIILHVTMNGDFLILPYDEILEHPMGLFVPNECIRGEKFSIPVFSEKVKHLLQQAYETYLEMERVQGEIEVLKTNIRHKEILLNEHQICMQNAALLVQQNRFEEDGSLALIAAQLTIEIEQDDMNDLHWTGISMKGMKVKNIRVEEGTVRLDIQFRKDWSQDVIPDMYWSGMYHDYVNWDDFREKHCPQLNLLVKEALPFSNIDSVKKTCDERLSKFMRNLETFTTYTVSFDISKDTYDEVYNLLMDGLLKLQTQYFSSNI